jgi:hydroxymethylpyrimidine pyrophosphatase-like HAD family hydrolase
MSNLILSPLPHTWLIDIDGTILEHNGHKAEGDKLLPNVKAFWSQISSQDVIVLLSARTSSETAKTLDFLKSAGLRFDHVLFNLPTGERILINDNKPSGLKTAISINLTRNEGFSDIDLRIDENL